MRRMQECNAAWSYKRSLSSHHKQSEVSECCQGVLSVFFVMFYNKYTFCLCAKGDHWWNSIVLTTFTPQNWIENVRMSWKTFVKGFMLYCVKGYGYETISLQRRVAITLWSLAMPTEYCSIAHFWSVNIYRF